jgi:glucan 1,3-beta-glucosidase
VTEKEIMNLKASGLDTLRIPVGDWMYVPYGPFIGCMDGALDELNRALRLCEKHGLKAVLDIHAMKGSQVRNRDQLRSIMDFLIYFLYHLLT